mgnify:CR=1
MVKSFLSSFPAMNSMRLSYLSSALFRGTTSTQTTVEPAFGLAFDRRSLTALPSPFR